MRRCEIVKSTKGDSGRVLPAVAGHVPPEYAKTEYVTGVWVFLSVFPDDGGFGSEKSGRLRSQLRAAVVCECRIKYLLETEPALFEAISVRCKDEI